VLSGERSQPRWNFSVRLNPKGYETSCNELPLFQRTTRLICRRLQRPRPFTYPWAKTYSTCAAPGGWSPGSSAGESFAWPLLWYVASAFRAERPPSWLTGSICFHTRPGMRPGTPPIEDLFARASQAARLAGTHRWCSYRLLAFRFFQPAAVMDERHPFLPGSHLLQTRPGWMGPRDADWDQSLH